MWRFSMLFLKKHWAIAVATVLGLLVSSQTQAAVLAPGGGPVAPDPHGDAFGAPLASETTVAFSTTVGISVKSAVYTDPVSGDLDFVYQVTNTGTDAIRRLSMVNFDKSRAGAVVDAGLEVAPPALPVGFFDPGGLVPATVDRSSGSGSVVGFNFAGGVFLSGVETIVLVIKTDAKVFDKNGFVNAIDGDVAKAGAFEPGPEPASLILLAGSFLGMGGAAAWRRWRKPVSAT
jgi:hypothetical protein